MTVSTDPAPRPPATRQVLLESRVVLDLARMALPMVSRPSPTARPRSVIVLPGFGADDRYTWPLRRHLARAGHACEGWGLGKNRAGIDIAHALDDVSAGWNLEQRSPYFGEASVPMLCDRMVERVRSRAAQDPLPIRRVLVGWSLGGVVAREVARELPELVSHVITLGTPVLGGPKYTSAARFFRGRGMDLDWIERAIGEREVRPIQARITTIYSPTDGVVGVGAAIDRHSPDVEHVEVDAAHIGLCFNPTVWRLVLEAIESGTNSTDADASGAGETQQSTRL